jgi:hypothetical protein
MCNQTNKQAIIYFIIYHSLIHPSVISKLTNKQNNKVNRLLEVVFNFVYFSAVGSGCQFGSTVAAAMMKQPYKQYVPCTLP